MLIPESSLIVSCQAPVDSPLFEPKMIAAMAKASINQGAKGIRINTPDHVKEVRKELPNTPIIGLWKQDYSGYDIYITPCYQDAVAIAEAGADIIAIDGTLRKRPQGEKLADRLYISPFWGMWTFNLLYIIVGVLLLLHLSYDLRSFFPNKTDQLST